MDLKIGSYCTASQPASQPASQQPASQRASSQPATGTFTGSGRQQRLRLQLVWALLRNEGVCHFSGRDNWRIWDRSAVLLRGLWWAANRRSTPVTPLYRLQQRGETLFYFYCHYLTTFLSMLTRRTFSWEKVAQADVVPCDRVLCLMWTVSCERC